jgi:hypothetical protein
MGKGTEVTNTQSIVLLIEVGILALAGVAYILRALR